MKIERLEYLLKGAQNDERFDWLAIEDNLELELPTEYKWFMDRYGAGGFAEFTFFHPSKMAQEAYKTVETAWQIYSDLRKDWSALPTLWRPGSERGHLLIGGDSGQGLITLYMSGTANYSVGYLTGDLLCAQYYNSDFIDFVYNLVSGLFVPVHLVGASFWSQDPEEPEIQIYSSRQ